MGVMKIAVWPPYKKTGSPTEKRRHQMQQIAGRIFAELLSLTGSGKQQRSTAKLPQASAPGQQPRS